MYFPVLRSGVAAQFPLTRVDDYFVIEAEAPGGAVWRAGSGRSPVRRWRLEYTDVSDEEAKTLAEFYEACGGSWQCFSFADPMANLVAWSEDLTKPVWLRSAGVTVERSGGESGPAEFLIINQGATRGRIWQELDLAPGSAVCFSCEIQGQAATLLAGGAMETVAGGGLWRRVFVAGTSSGGLQGVGIELEAGASVRVRSLQAEVQIAPSEYQPTREMGGVFPRTRFSQDGLRITATAPDRNQVRIVLESSMENGL